MDDEYLDGIMKKVPSNHSNPSDTPQIEHPAAEFQGADDLVKRLRTNGPTTCAYDQDRMGKAAALITNLRVTIEQQAKHIEELEATNETLVLWKGEIDSWRIALGLSFPSDYDNSPKYAIKTLVDAELEAARTPNPGKTHFADDDTLAYIAKLQAELDEAVSWRDHWHKVCGDWEDRNEEQAAQIALAREAIQGLWANPNWKPDGAPLSVISPLQRALSTLTTSNAVQAIEAMAYERAIAACEEVGPKEYPAKLVTEGFVQAIRKL